MRQTWAPWLESSLRGWVAVNLFLLGMVGVAAGLLLLAFASIRALHLSPNIEHGLMGGAAVVTVIAAGLWGKILLSLLEKRSRA